MKLEAAIEFHLAGNYVEAEHGYRKFLASNPNHSHALFSLGHLLHQLGHHSESLPLLKRAATLDPANNAIWDGIGNVLRATGQYLASIDAFTHALLIRRTMASWNNMGQAYREMGMFEEAITCGRQALLTAEPNDPDVITARTNMIFTMAYGCTETPEIIHREARAWYDENAADLANVLPPVNPDRSPDRRLRIGFVSGDFRAHVIARAIMGTLAGFRHIREFEIFAYSNTLIEDAVTTKIEGMVDHWRRIATMSNHEAANLIREDRIDILVDLSGHTDGNRLLLFAANTAPIKVAYLGATSTLGMPTMDYFLASEDLCPSDTTEVFTEKVWRLPTCWQSHVPPEDAPDVTIPTGPFTFGSFNALAKIGPDTVRLWTKVLQAVPDSRLLLKTKGLGEARMQKQVLEGFSAIDPGRIVFMPHSPSFHEHQATYGQIDIALDPTPFTGGATTEEALWMGVPVITLRGDRIVGRMSAAMLHAIGSPQWIARTEQEYVDIATVYACRSNLTDLRMGQREHMRSSSYCDGDRMARDLGEAFRGMWKIYLANNARLPDAVHDALVQLHPGRTVVPKLSSRKASLLYGTRLAGNR